MHCARHHWILSFCDDSISPFTMLEYGTSTILTAVSSKIVLEDVWLKTIAAIMTQCS